MTLPIRFSKSHPVMFLFLILLFSSCSQNFYAPTGGNLPIIQDKGSLSIQGSFGASNPSFGASTSMTYAPSNHLAFSSSFFKSRPLVYQTPHGVDLQSRSGHGQYMEIGMGYYSNELRSLKFREGVSILCFAGYGKGNFSTSVLQSKQIVDLAQLNFQKMWLQPTAFIHNHFFDLGFSLRTGLVSFQKGSFSGDKFAFERAFNFYKKQDSFVVLEPTIQLRVGRSDMVQFMFSATATSMPEDISTNTVMGVGMQCQLDYILKKVGL